MTKVKKTKKPKPKAKKAAKKTVTKNSASVEKIDVRLRSTPEPQLVKIDPRLSASDKVDPMLRNPLKIVDVPRTQIYPYQQTLPTFARASAAVPTYMFSGQDTANLSRRLDVITSKEQQLETKLLDLKNQLEKEKEAKKDVEDYSQIQSLGQRVENYKNDVGDEDIVELNNEIKELLKDKTLNSVNRDLLIDLRIYAKQDIASNIASMFKEAKSTNTLLDDVIHDNDLVDEAEILIEEIKSKRKIPSFEEVQEVITSKLKGMPGKRFI